MPFLQSISSFFTGQQANNASSSRQNRRTAMNSTFDAFSLPTSRYGDGGGLGANDAMDSNTSSPGPSRRGSASYAYPPARDAYQPSTGRTHPPVSHTFHRIRKTLAETFPELLETLNGPVDASLLGSFERELGCQLPPSVRESFTIADGQDMDSGCSGLFFGLYLLSLEDVMREWAFWRQAEHDPEAGKNPAVLATMASVPPSWIKQLYACRGWIPLLSDRAGNYVGVDLDPGQGGSWGQVIIFGRDFDRKVVLWKGDGEGGWGKWLASFADDLESGDGWEADKSGSSDEEEEMGYGSYNGGAQYGESGRGLRLAGEYKGWNVLEAWWDKSVRQWEQLGLGLDVEAIERGLNEARRLAGFDDEEEEGQAGPSHSGGQPDHVDVPIYVSTHPPQAPGTPVPGDSDALLPPSSPDVRSQIPKFHQKIPVRVITPIASASDHPLQGGPSTAPTDRDLSSGYLSPPGRRKSRAPPPVPTAIDLPTRADVQAMSAIADAEASGLRGGWIMNIDPGNAARRQRTGENEMVDIDLEGGKGEKFGSPRISAEDMERLREEEKLSLAGIEQRNSPRMMYSRTPSPLARNGSLEIPVLSPSSGIGMGHPAGFESVSPLKRPPPIATYSDSSMRKHGTADEDRDTPVVRDRVASRSVRESSIFSESSQDGLLEVRSRPPSRSSSPVTSDYMASSPVTITGRRSTEYDDGNKREILGSLEDDMQDISLSESIDGKRGSQGLREVAV